MPPSELDMDALFARTLALKRAGGQALVVDVSAGIWLGGMNGARTHAPFVSVAPDDSDGDDDAVTFFADRDALERFIGELRAAADRAWGPTGAATESDGGR